MIKIDNLKLNKNNKDILEKYQIYLLTVKQKEEKTTVSSYIEDIYKYLEYMENNKNCPRYRISKHNKLSKISR